MNSYDGRTSKLFRMLRPGSAYGLRSSESVRILQKLVKKHGEIQKEKRRMVASLKHSLYFCRNSLHFLHYTEYVLGSQTTS